MKTLNPVKGAEHWATSSVLPKVFTGVVFSPRINFNTSVQQSGEIMYGNFAVQHDLDAHRERFTVPQESKGNILRCCDDMDQIDSEYFKHGYAVRQAAKAALV